MSSKKKDPPEPMEEKELPAQESEKAPEAPQPEPAVSYTHLTLPTTPYV